MCGLTEMSRPSAPVPGGSYPHITVTATQHQTAVHVTQTQDRTHTLPTVHRVALGKEERLFCQEYQAAAAGPDKHFTGRGKVFEEELWPGRGGGSNEWQPCAHGPLTNTARNFFSTLPRYSLCSHTVSTRHDHQCTNTPAKWPQG